MNVELTADQRTFVQKAIESRRISREEEAIQEALDSTDLHRNASTALRVRGRRARTRCHRRLAESTTNRVSGQKMAHGKGQAVLAGAKLHAVARTKRRNL